MNGKIVRSNPNISVAKIAQSVNLPLKKTTETPKKFKSLLVPKNKIINIDKMVSGFLKNLKPKAKKTKKTKKGSKK